MRELVATIANMTLDGECDTCRTIWQPGELAGEHTPYDELACPCGGEVYRQGGEDAIMTLNELIALARKAQETAHA